MWIGEQKIESHRSENAHGVFQKSEESTEVVRVQDPIVENSALETHLRVDVPRTERNSGWL